MSKSKVHYTLNPPCGVLGERWGSSVITSTRNLSNVTCKSCLRCIAGKEKEHEFKNKKEFVVAKKIFSLVIEIDSDGFFHTAINGGKDMELSQVIDTLDRCVVEIREEISKLKAEKSGA